MSGRSEDMIMAIIRYLGENMIVSADQANYFLQKLNALPADIAEDNDQADYIRVCIYIQGFQIDKALELLDAMERRLIKDGNEDAKKMLGEVYERRAGVGMMQRDDRFMEHYKKASEYLPEGSAYKNKKMLRYKNYSIVAIGDYGPGALQRMEKAVHKDIEYMKLIEHAGAGFQYLFSAEAAYYQYDFERSKNMAHRAVFEAEAAKQHDIVCDAYSRA